MNYPKTKNVSHIKMKWHRFKHQAPTKRSQHSNATYRNTVRHNMLFTFGHPVATCCVLLAQVWKWSNVCRNIFGCYMMFYSFDHFPATLLRRCMRTSSICYFKEPSDMLQHAATGWRVQHVVYNNVAICFVGKLTTKEFPGKKIWREMGFCQALF